MKMQAVIGPLSADTTIGHESLTDDLPFEYLDDQFHLGRLKQDTGGCSSLPQWDDLVTALCDQAINCHSDSSKIRRATPFDNDFREGIALDATIEAQMRGDNQLHVFGSKPARKTPIQGFEGWPVVWIFDDQRAEESDWRIYVEPLDRLTPFVRNPQQFEQRFMQKYSELAAFLGYGHESTLSDAMQEKGISLSTIHGCLVWGPVFNNDRQYAWFAEAHYRQLLFYQSTMFGLPGKLKEYADLVSEGSNIKPRWQDQMIAMALPFANRRLTVVIPKAFKINPHLNHLASTMGKEICTISIDRFDQNHVERIKKIYSVPGLTINSRGETEFPPFVEKLLGESTGCYQHLVPPRIRKYGYRL